MLGIKETPLSEVLNDPVPAPGLAAHLPRTHLMFSHTIKGQMYNMELLAKFVAGEPAPLPRLVDYELLTGEDGKRTVGFGWFAGGQCFALLTVRLGLALTQFSTQLRGRWNHSTHSRMRISSSELPAPFW